MAANCIPVRLRVKPNKRAKLRTFAGVLIESWSVEGKYCANKIENAAANDVSKLFAHVET